MSKIYDALTKANHAPPASERNGVPEPQYADRETEIVQSDGLRPTSNDQFNQPQPDAAEKQVLLYDRDDSRPGKANDEFQVLAMRTQGLLKENGKSVVLVTSAVPDEGKSFVVSNLGLALAKLGRRVILVDCDLRTPSLHRGFGVSPLHGLISYLMRKAELANCIYPTSVPGLSLIPAGGTTNSAPELFSCPRMAEFLAAARSSDPDAVILIDSPPVLAASETRIVASLVDAVMVIVAANQTSRSSVERTLSFLKDLPIMGMVLNKFEPVLSRRTEYGYGYTAERDDASMF